jgi:magnesium-transporting ATPase (P-type)
MAALIVWSRFSAGVRPGPDILPSLALGAEPPDADVMTRPPRPVNERLLSGPVVVRFLFLGAIQAAGVCFAFFWRIHSAHLGSGHFTAANPVYGKHAP